VNLRRKMENDIERDMRDHIEMETRDNIDRGMSPEEARQAAVRRFGNTMRIAEDTRAVWRREWIDRMCQDALHAFRGLYRNPVFAVAAILTLALGMGMSTAVFSVVSAVLIKPLPYPDAGRLVWLANYNKRFHFEASSAPDFADWQDQASSYEAMAGYLDVDCTVQDSSESTKNPFVIVTSEFWQIAGAHASLGRLFTKDDQDVVVITWKMFEQRFGSDRRVVGRVVSVDGRPRTIVGVLPKDFRFLLPGSSATGMPGGIHTEPEAFAPNIVTPELRSRSGGVLLMYVVAKLRTGVSIDRARAELRNIQARVAGQNPSFRAFYAASEIRVVPLKERLVWESREPLLILLAAVGLVLLIACANFGNLLLARATARRREVATRIAIGAGRGRMLGHLAAEGLMLATFGAACGIVFAWLCDALLIRMSPNAVPRMAETGIDWRVLMFAFAISLLAGAVFGLAPLFLLSSRSLYAQLKEGGTNSSAGGDRLRLRRVLVAGEMALALVLLTGAGLMLKSFGRMYAHPPGFEPEKIGTMKVFLSGPAYRERQASLEYARRLIERLSQVPGVEASAVTNASGTGPARVQGMTFPEGQAPQVRFRSASAGYARVVGLPLIAGRWTTDRETVPAVMVNESFVRRVFAGREPLGRLLPLQEFNNKPVPIVGVVGDLKTMRLDAGAEPEVLIPYQETDTTRRVDILFKTPGALRAVLPEVRRAVERLDSTQPPYEVRTLEDALAESIAPFRFDLLLLGTFAASAVLLALIGIYGVMSYSVTQRTREIGVRIALGARRGEIARMMLWQAMTVAFAGIAVGTAAALTLTRLITELLYDVKPNDPAIFAAVATGLAGTCLLASWVPALKAARVEPLNALRHE